MAMIVMVILAQLEEKLGLGPMSSFGFVPNSIYAVNISGPCGQSCQGQDYTFGITDQNWWRSHNPKIHSWYKAFVYIPPLVPAEVVGLKNYPDNPDEVVRRNCQYQKQSLDKPVIEIESDKFDPYHCGFFAIGHGWYITLHAGFDLP